ncbi:MAG: hypothetical protein KAJ64_04785 [Thermoplasmata archaeon]|nr:hypothetical protein [Thermoplasmata archaeon]
MEQGYKIDNKEVKMASEPWDYLIILDACRYDIFKEIYQDYLPKGDFKKAIAPSLHTMDWLNKAFPDYYDDIVYVSANPYVNSKTKVENTIGFDYEGTKHFLKVIDAWDWGWDDRVGSIFPDKINKGFFDNFDKYGDKRFVLHYIQPHKPFIGDEYIKYYDVLKSTVYADSRKHDVKMQQRKKTLKKTIKDLAIRIIIKTMGKSFLCKLSSFIHGGPQSPEDAIWIAEGQKGYVNAYRDNLKLALKSAKEIVDKVPSGRILITADHGEFLGEYGRYGHPNDITKPENTEVPWLIIDKGKRVITQPKTTEIKDDTETAAPSKEDEDAIKAKLKNLGYF